MKKKIMKIINKWDPIGIKAVSPKDEYLYEVDEIEMFINNSNNINIELLSNEIDRIFKKWFGNDVFSSDYETIKQVAEEIILACNLEKTGKFRG